MPESQVTEAARDDPPQEGGAAALAPSRWRTLIRAAVAAGITVEDTRPKPAKSQPRAGRRRSRRR